jgi:hypothetical protein
MARGVAGEFAPRNVKRAKAKNSFPDLDARTSEVRFASIVLKKSLFADD